MDEDVEEVLHLPILGTLGRLPEAAQQSGIYRLVMLLYPRSAAAEAFRTMRTNVEFADIDSGLHSLLVTSPAAGDGKSTVAANLALAFAQAGRRTILVDADLRKPTRSMSCSTQSNTLRPDDPHPLRGHRPGRRSCGPSTSPTCAADERPSAAQPGRAARLQPHAHASSRTSRREADLVVFDSPPSAAVTDAAVLASLIDGTIVVVAAGQHAPGDPHAVRTRRSRASAGTSSGVVLNRHPRAGPDAAYDAYPTRAGGRAARRGPRPAQDGALEVGSLTARRARRGLIAG